MAKTKDELQYVLCDLCGSDDSTKKFQVNQFYVVTCKVCGLTYVNPRLKQFDGIYNENYFSNEDLIKNNANTFGYTDYRDDEPQRIRQFESIMKRIKNYVKKGKVLDVGCAFGYFLKAAEKEGFEAAGVEISKYAVSRAKQNNLNVINSKLKDANFKSSSFDVVTIFDVIEHVASPSDEFREINRVLKKSGLLVLETPDEGSFLVRHILKDKWEEYRRAREHIYFFSKKTIRKLAEQNGFKVLKIGTIGKYMTIDEIIDRILFYFKALRPVIMLFKKFIGKIGIAEVVINIDPRYKMLLFAEKTDDIC